MSERSSVQPHLLIPVGTQIVTRVTVKSLEAGERYPTGAVGVVVSTPVDNTHAYRVCLPDGATAMLHRQAFAVRKQLQQDGLQAAETALGECELEAYVIYRCVIGSRAYGLDHSASDTDRRGIYLPPAERHWSLYGVPEQLEHRDTEECYWELQKFLVLALKANPNVLECLYTPLIEMATPLADELLAMRRIFLSQLVYQTYNGYVLSQFKKLEQDLRNHGAIKWKHAMHLIRLLLSGITVLQEGFVPVRLDDYRERLLAIRRAEVPWEGVNAWRLQLHKAFDAAFTTTPLPARPDYARANAFLLKARRSMVAAQ